MAKEIVRTIRSAGRTFDRDEWNEYCREKRDDPRKCITTQIGRFLYNDCDVCLNHDVMSLVVDRRLFYVTIEVADCGNGCWTHGVSLAAGNGGDGYGCSFRDPRDEREWMSGHPTEREARLAACHRALDWLGGRDSENVKVKRLRAMVEDYMKSITRPQVIQLELF